MQNHLVGISFKNIYHKNLVPHDNDIAWLEIHPENYFGGGLLRQHLSDIFALYPISMHAAGLSLGADSPVCSHHLSQLKILTDLFNPVRISDHASWSHSGNAHLGDLLPLPYNDESLSRLADNISRTQNFLKRQILIENPSTYLSFNIDTYTEAEFLNKSVQKTGCGLLLDINNIYVQSHNHGFNPYDYIDEIDGEHIQEIHLAGHIVQQFPHQTLLIDTHSQIVCDAVWDLYNYTVKKYGHIPTLIEWDMDLPDYDTMKQQVAKACHIIMQNSPVQSSSSEFGVLSGR